MAHILRAIADGKVVQVRTITRYPNPRGEEQGNWTDLKTDEAFSLFPGCSGHEYRIKPKPTVKKWKWLIDLNPKGTQHLYITPKHFSSKEKILEITPCYKVLQRMEETLIEEEED